VDVSFCSSSLKDSNELHEHTCLFGFAQNLSSNDLMLVSLSFSKPGSKAAMDIPDVAFFLL
jgi:hypothetical protein